MPRLNEQQLLERERKKLRKGLVKLTQAVQVFSYLLDAQMREPSTHARGRKIARMLNWLEHQNDSVRYGTLGIDFRRDDNGGKERETKRLIARMKR